MSRPFTFDQWLRREYGVQADSLEASFTEAQRRAWDAGRMEGIREGERERREDVRSAVAEAEHRERSGEPYGTY